MASSSVSSHRLLTMASSSVSSQGSQKYDVFLNFRGHDVRFNFLSYLILAFNHAYLNFFVDNKLERGEHIETALMLAIQDSKVALTIFSKGYVSSSWCLDELVKIMECRESPTLRQKVIPIFFHVTPSDVRNVETGVFAQDFAKYQNDDQSRSKIPHWKHAMKIAGSLSGRIVNETSSEANVLIQIVDDVLQSLRRSYPILSNPGEKKLFHASIHNKLHVFLHNLNGKLKDCSNIQQQQRNGSMWTISRQQGRPVQVDSNEFLMSIRVQVEGKPFEAHLGQRSDTSNSHPSPPVSYYCFDLGNGNWGYGYPVDYGNGYCGYNVNLGNGNWSYYVDRGNGNLYPYEWVVVEQAKQRQGQGRSDQAGSGRRGAATAQIGSAIARADRISNCARRSDQQLCRRGQQ